jgi:hypothetical protein
MKSVFNEYEIQRADEILFRDGVEDYFINDGMRLQVLKAIGLRK